MDITVEYFGIPRQKTGVCSDSLSFSKYPVNLQQVLAEISLKHTDFTNHCMDGDQLSRQTIINLNGDQFVESLQTEVMDGDNILILSTDAGG